MRGFLAVAQREVVEWWSWLAAAAFIGLLPLAVPLLPWVGTGNTTDARSTMALILAVTLVSGGALGLGSSMIARDLSERRLGFYFARPLEAAAIWWGKLVATFLVVFLAGLLVLVPTALLSGSSALGEPLGLEADGGLLLAGAAVYVLLLLGVANSLAVAGRSRLPLLVLDLVVAAVLGMAIWWMVSRLRLTDPYWLYPRLLAVVAAAVLVALLAAGWVHVAIGRCDARRGHRALSATLWGVLGGFALVLAGFTAWVYAVTPSSLTVLRDVLPARQGAWTVVSGVTTGRGRFTPTFLVNAEDRRWVRVETVGRWYPFCTFSADGRLAAWMTPTGVKWGDPVQVYTVDLGVDNPHPLATSLIVRPSEARGAHFSPDGRLLAMLGSKAISVYSLPDGSLVRAVRVESDLMHLAMRFVGQGELAVEKWEGSERDWSKPVDVTLWRLDISSGRLVQTGTIRGVVPRDAWRRQVDPRGELMLATHVGKDSIELTLHDARTGSVRACLLAWPRRPHLRGGFLADGRVVVAETRVPEGQAALLHVFGRDGTEQRTIELGLGTVKVLGGEVTPGVLAVGFGPGNADWRGGRTLLVDIERGTLERLAEGYVPSPGSGWWSGQVATEPGGPTSRLFRTAEGGLALFDPSTGLFKQVLTARWPT